MSNTWSATGTRSVKAVCTTGTETVANPVKASQTVAFSSAVAGNTVTVRGVTFTAIANGSTPANPQEFAVGAGGSANTDTGAAFAAAVNALKHILGITATNATGTVTLAADTYGAGPNAWTLTRVGAPITVGGATFANGVDVVGINLSGVKFVTPCLEAGAGQTVASGKLVAYLLNPASMLWSPCTALDVTLSATTSRGQTGNAVDVGGRCGYAAWVPSGVTISSGSATLYLNAINCAGNAV